MKAKFIETPLPNDIPRKVINACPTSNERGNNSIDNN